MPAKKVETKYLQDGNVIFFKSATYVDPVTGAKSAFRMGETLPEGWHYEVDEAGNPVRAGCMKLISEGKRQIQKDRMASLGINPKSEKAKAKGATRRKAARLNTIDFLEVTDDEGRDLKKDFVAQALKDQFGLDIDTSKYSVEDLVDMGRDAALEGQGSDK